MEITKQMVEDYESIRSSGVTNMFDYKNVIHIAKTLKMEGVAKLSLKDYANLCQNYSSLMNKFNIKRR
jgi:hypothetical protein